MYNSNYKCWYDNEDIMFSRDELQKLSQEDKHDIKDVIYKEDFLNIFGLNIFDEKAINEEMELLYERVNGIESLHPLLDTLANRMLSDDRFDGFYVLFSYDYLYLFHQFLCDIINSNNINTGIIKQLTEMVKN